MTWLDVKNLAAVMALGSHTVRILPLLTFGNWSLALMRHVPAQPDGEDAVK